METQNTQPMPEKKGKKTLILSARPEHGINPLFSRLERELLGIVEAQTKTYSELRAIFESDENKRKYAEELRQYDLILTDNSVTKSLEEITKYLENSPQIHSVYDLLNKLTEESALDDDPYRAIEKITAQLRSEGKEVAILPYALEDHFTFKTEELEKRLGEGKVKDINQKLKKGFYDFKTDSFIPEKKLDGSNESLAYALGELFGVKVITCKVYRNPDPVKAALERAKVKGFKIERDQYGTSFSGKITDALSEIELNPEKTIILADHHIYHLENKGVIESGFNQVEIYPICQCCSNTNPFYLESLKRRGFRIAEVKVSEKNITPLLEEIKKKIAE